MTNLQKFYKLALNMLEHHADVMFAWDSDKEEYEIFGAKLHCGWWEIEIGFNFLPAGTWVNLKNTNTDEDWFTILPDELDPIFNALRYSYFDYLLEGIE